MKILSVDYVISAHSALQYPAERFPDIAFAGRSNVGKSSLINTLLKRRNLARVSSTPGKTRSINFFLVNRSFYFVDLPGYGFARISQDEQRQWRQMVEQYLRAETRAKLVVLLLDIRHELSPLDVQMKEWLEHFAIQHTLVATKADKVSGNDRFNRLHSLRKLWGTFEVIPFSATTELGRLELWKQIQIFLKNNQDFN